jgi:hypothetical protein
LRVDVQLQIATFFLIWSLVNYPYSIVLIGLCLAWTYALQFLHNARHKLRLPDFISDADGKPARGG